jgi:hypothetical protein
MTTVFRMPDGTHVRVNDEDIESMPEDWELVGPAADQSDPQFVGTAEARGEAEELPKAEEKPKAKAKVVEGPKK